MVTYLIEREVIEAKFKINDGPLVVALVAEQIMEVTSDILVKLVVGQVQ